MKQKVLNEAIRLMKDKATPDSTIMTYLTRHEDDWDRKTIDTPDKKGITLLMYASAYGKEHTVKYLLSKGANPVAAYTNKNGTTNYPSQMAAANKHPKIVKMLDVAKNRMQQSAMSSDKFKSLVEGLSEADAQSVADCLSRASTKSRVSSSASTRSRRTTNSERSAKKGQRQPSLRDLLSEETDVQSMRTLPRSSRSRRSSGSSVIIHISGTTPRSSRSTRSSGSSVSTRISRVTGTPTLGSLRLSLSPKGVDVAGINNA